MNSDRVVLAYSGEEEYEGWDGATTVKAAPGDDWVKVSPEKALQLLSDFPEHWELAEGKVDEDEIEARRAADAAYEGGGTGSEPEAQAEPEPEPEDLGANTRKELDAIAADLDVPEPDKLQNKAAVIAAIEEARAAAATAEPDGEEPEDLSEKTRAELDAIAANLEIPEPEKLQNKAAVIAAIEEARAAAEPDDGEPPPGE